ncbi:MAG: hypothetical protein IKU70_01175 [Clostridia bacterium]|nr:hypothetical protein [Clostridia bacterium]
MTGWHTRLPRAVKGRAEALGKPGIDWISQLDENIAYIEKQWKITVIDVLEGGSTAFVGLSCIEHGAECILKISLPNDPLDKYALSVNALRSADGKGYCRLYADDIGRRAVLLERLGPRLSQSGLPPEKQMEILCKAMQEIWQSPVDPVHQKDAQNKHSGFSSFIKSAWSELNPPYSSKIVCTALHFADELQRRTDPSQYVNVHGDAHNNNMLLIPGTQEYKLIDPDGLIFEKSYDVGVLMREWPDEFEEDALAKGRERSKYLSHLTGVNETDIWEWGFLQMTTTALILLSIGQNELGRQMLDVAEKWC